MLKTVRVATAAAAALMIGSAASASTAVIGSINATDYGYVSPNAQNFNQSGTAVGSAQIQVGQPGQSPTTTLGNPGWDPYGTSDTTHSWWNLESGTVTLMTTGSAFNMVWGSPNDDNPNATNTVEFFNGASMVGTVTAYDLYSDFPSNSFRNTYGDTGYLMSFAVQGGFDKVVFTTGASDFEFAVTSVPEASTWAMMLVGFAGLGFAGYRTSRRAATITA